MKSILQQKHDQLKIWKCDAKLSFFEFLQTVAADIKVICFLLSAGSDFEKKIQIEKNQQYVRSNETIVSMLFRSNQTHLLLSYGEFMCTDIIP